MSGMALRVFCAFRYCILLFCQFVTPQNRLFSKNLWVSPPNTNLRGIERSYEGQPVLAVHRLHLTARISYVASRIPPLAMSQSYAIYGKQILFETFHRSFISTPHWIFLLHDYISSTERNVFVSLRAGVEVGCVSLGRRASIIILADRVLAF